MKVLTVVGARPQFIKAAPVSRALVEAGCEEILVHTGQHYDFEMSDIFFQELQMPAPSVNLGIGSDSHGAQTGKMLAALEQVMEERAPSMVLIYGDTNSTLAAALAASKMHIPVAHVEAGLRSFNRRMPEEVNRIVADALSDILFVPTRQAAANLLSEGVPTTRIHDVGDVMYDAAIMFGKLADRGAGVLTELGILSDRFILATIHRPENTDEPTRLENIVTAIDEIANTFDVVWPLHPRTRAALQRAGRMPRNTERVHVIGPVGYLEMIRLEKSAALILTDSGGVQKEAFFCRVPCVTLRDQTEWVESVELGWNQICPPLDVRHLIEVSLAAVGSVGREGWPYGRGDTAQRIASILSASPT